MSHTTKINSVKIRDIKALKLAVKEMQDKGVKCSLIENATPRMYYRDQERDIGKCAYVLKLENCNYDVGFIKGPDGSYSPVFDEWAGAIKSEIGSVYKGTEAITEEQKTQQHIGSFMQSYAKHAAINTAEAQGYRVSGVTTDELGNIHIDINGSTSIGEDLSGGSGSLY